MDREAIEEMLEIMLIGDSDRGKLRRLLIEHEQEIQHLRNENERLKQAFADCEKKRAGEQDGTIVNMMRPQPCRKFKMISTADWITKLMEEVSEAIRFAVKRVELDDDKDWLDDEDMLTDKLGEELTDVITVCTSWLDAFGYDEVARGKLQEKVNEKNRKRGYWG